MVLLFILYLFEDFSNPLDPYAKFFHYLQCVWHLNNYCIKNV